MNAALDTLIPLESVAERDIDLLLLEEFHVSDSFARWFWKRAFRQDAPVRARLSAWHSIADTQLGESDLIVAYQDDLGSRLAVLIENKVTAISQPNQAERYK